MKIYKYIYIYKMHKCRRYPKPSNTTKTFVESGTYTDCFYVIEIDDVIGKCLNNKFFKKQLKLINF